MCAATNVPVGALRVAAVAVYTPLAAMPVVRGMCPALLLCIVCLDQSCMLLEMQAKDAGLHARSIMKSSIPKGLIDSSCRKIIHNR